jgi:hypothetical protein
MVKIAEVKIAEVKIAEVKIADLAFELDICLYPPRHAASQLCIGYLRFLLIRQSETAVMKHWARTTVRSAGHDNRLAAVVANGVASGTSARRGC